MVTIRLLILVIPLAVPILVAADDRFPAHTSWGHPSLEGSWDFRSATPLERPEAIGDKVRFTGEEAQDFELTSEDRVLASLQSRDVFVGDEPWADRGQTLTEGLRTSLIIDPPSGRLPSRTSLGEENIARFRAAFGGVPAGPEDLGVLERCITAHMVPMRPSWFNSNVQIVQTPDYVVIVNEMVHDARIVPLDSRNKTPNLRRWLGQSRGHFEGDTLVVKTSHFRDQANRLGMSAEAEVTERFTRMDDDHLSYEYTVNDPAFTSPWTARQTFTRLDGRIYEYACHEGNYSMVAMLRGARLEEADHVGE